MILVRNHQQQLSGNKFLWIAIVALAFGACSPKVGVLKSPDHRAGSVGTPKTEETNKESEVKVSAAEAFRLKKLKENSISLLLPFQLDQVNTNMLSRQDVERSAMALDFYQGFQMGLDELAAAGTYYGLNVLDSRDNEAFISSLAASEKIANSSLIVGPVFPKEITSFGKAHGNKGVLQINPLAATKASDFRIPNLVSLTPSIDVHSNAIAEKVAKDYRQGDVIIVYNTSDNDGKQFLEQMFSAIKKQKPSAKIEQVYSSAELNEVLTRTGANLLVTGTTDRNSLRMLLGNLTAKNLEEYYIFKLYGHPLWDRIDFSNFDNFSAFEPVITSEGHLKAWSANVRDFDKAYLQRYTVQPSDFSYKGYDAAKYFGRLLDKHGYNYVDQLTKESYEGIFNSYDFEHNDQWGYTNKGVSFKVYKGTSFQLK